MRASPEEIVQSFHAISGYDDFVLDIVLLEGSQSERFIVGIVFHQ
jgi:hypothetical protein